MKNSNSTARTCLVLSTLVFFALKLSAQPGPVWAVVDRNAFPGESIDYHSIVDYNNDGLEDMIARQYAGGEMYFYENTGTDLQLDYSLTTQTYIQSTFGVNTAKRSQFLFDGDGEYHLSLLDCQNI